MTSNTTFLCRIIGVLCFVFAVVLSPKLYAQESSQPAQSNNLKGQVLQRIIEEQQRQLDAQQQQLAEQQEQLKLQNLALQQLREQMQVFTGSTMAPEVAMKPEKSTSGDVHVRRSDTQAPPKEKTSVEEEWQGSFGVLGTNTRVKIGGFAELDVIHDTDAIVSKGQFVTSTIPTRGATKAEGSDGQTNFSVNPTRLYIETRTPLGKSNLKTFISMDFFGDAMGVHPDPRMRQAYGELTDILFGGDVLIGQAWTTFSDLEAFPDVLDFQGPNSFFGARQPLVRWSKVVADGLKLMIAAETPDNHILDGADSLTRWPDGVLSIVWDDSPVHLMGSVVARDLRGSYNDGSTETAFGWGASFSGKVGMPCFGEKDKFTFSATYGEGIGSNFNDQPSDAVFNSTGTSFEAIPVFGWFLSYEHWWSHSVNSTVVYGSLDVDNLDIQSPESLDRTQYTSANLVWMVTEKWLLGVECLWGEREDKDRASGSDFRSQLTSRFTF